MFEKAKSGRDAFTFSLRGMTTIASFTVAPAIAHDRINKVIDQRLGRQWEDQPLEDQPSTTTRDIENFLARYFAPGRRAA